MSAFTIVLLVLSQVALVASQIFLKHCMNLAALTPRRWPRVSLHFALGVAALTLWYLLWLGFLQTMPLSQVMPWEGLSPVLLLFGAAVFLREKIAPSAWLGIALISAGVVLVSVG